MSNTKEGLLSGPIMHMHAYGPVAKNNENQSAFRFLAAGSITRRNTDTDLRMSKEVILYDTGRQLY